MGREYRTYDNQLRQHIIKLVMDDGYKLKQISREMDIPYGTVKQWVADYREEQGEKELKYITPGEYYNREKELLDRIKELAEENEIIKKAAHIFAKSQK
ncbi:transposase [Virgibacillus sp. FSP13]